MEQAHVILELAGDILDQYQKLRAALAVHSQPNWAPSLQDLRWQIDRLVYRGFLLHTPFDALQDYPRYLKGAQLRLEKLGHAAARDQQRMAEMEELFKKWRQRDEKARTDGKADPRLDEIRWLLEELRISLFAQELKTRVPVSVKRLEKRWQELGL
jgi:ATP-dependent helicase HrpA